MHSVLVKLRSLTDYYVGYKRCSVLKFRYVIMQKTISVKLNAEEGGGMEDIMHNGIDASLIPVVHFSSVEQLSL